MSNKKVLFITKFPPWQGGTATHALTAALAFLHEGYETQVLTLEPRAEIGLTHDLDDFDKSRLEGLSITRLPLNNQKVGTLVGDAAFSLLLGEAISNIKSNNIDFVIGWYFEPFGMAAAIASKISKIPCFLRHAGSDLDRLTENPSLSSAYSSAFSECEAIFSNTSNSGVMERIERLGLPMSKILNLPGAKLPSYFTEHKSKAIAKEGEEQIRFLIYGKISPYKGVDELVGVVGRLNSIGIKSRLINVAAGDHQSFLRKKTRYCEILDDASSLEMLRSVSPWRIPELMAACDFICVLENNFPIEIHSGMILREALSSGKVVIISRAIVNRSPFHESLCDGLNCIIIDDVQDIEAFANKVFLIAKDEARRRSIGYLSLKLSNFIEGMFPERHPMVQAVEERLGWSVEISTK